MAAPAGRKVIKGDVLPVLLEQKLLKIAQEYEDRVKDRVPRIFKQVADQVLLENMRRKYLRKGPKTLDSSRLRAPGGILTHSLWMGASPFKYSKAKTAITGGKSAVSHLHLRMSISPNSGIIFGYFHEYGFHGQVNIASYQRRRPGALRSISLEDVRKKMGDVDAYMVTVKAHSKKYTYLGRRYIQPTLEDSAVMSDFYQELADRLEKYLRSLGYRTKVKARR